MRLHHKGTNSCPSSVPVIAHSAALFHPKSCVKAPVSDPHLVPTGVRREDENENLTDSFS